MSVHGPGCDCGRVRVWCTRRWMDESHCWAVRECGGLLNIALCDTHAEALAAAWAHIKEHS